MKQVTTTETVRQCPYCSNNEFTTDYKREETYCTHCGLVLTNAFQYVGLEKVHNTIPYSAPAMARDKVHHQWTHNEDRGKRDNRRTTTYKHNIPNWKLMLKGKK